MEGGNSHPKLCIMPASSSRDLLIAQIGGHVTNPCKRWLKTPKKVTGKKLVENIYLRFPLECGCFFNFHVLECGHISLECVLPIASMYGIYTYIYHKNQPNVAKYTIHGCYGLYIGKFWNNCCRFRYSQVGPLENFPKQNLNENRFLGLDFFGGETTRRFFSNWMIICKLQPCTRIRRNLSGGFIFLFWYSHFQIWV